jgi:general secretion pathway protein G
MIGMVGCFVEVGHSALCAHFDDLPKVELSACVLLVHRASGSEKEGVDKRRDCLHCEYMTCTSTPAPVAALIRWFLAQRRGWNCKASVCLSPRGICLRGAFTLIELLVVVAFIAILAGFTLAALGGVNDQAARKRAKVEISSMANALESYRSQYGGYPSAANGDNVPYTNIAPFLGSEKITVEGGVVKDPFGNPYVYIFPGSKNRASFDLYSGGRDPGQTNSFIGNW